MSRIDSTFIKCPRCENIFEIEVYDSINASLDPKLKEKLMINQLFHKVCPHCGFKLKLNYTYLYHDMEKKLMFYYVTDEEQEKHVRRMICGSGGESDTMMGMALNMGYTFRIVRNDYEMLEKIAIFDAGLDDMVIELFKLMAEECGIMTVNDPGEARIVYYQSHGTDMIYVIENGHQKDAVPIPPGMYESVRKTHEDLLEKKGIDPEDIVIDREWARKNLRDLEE